MANWTQLGLKEILLIALAILGVLVIKLAIENSWESYYESLTKPIEAFERENN